MTSRLVYWYVLFVRTGREEKIVEELKQKLNNPSIIPFVLKKTFIFRRGGSKSLFSKICFPGYVFIETNQTSEAFMKNVFPVIFPIRDIFRFLCYGENKLDIAMRYDEMTELDKIFGKKRCIDISSGFKDGDAVRVISGSLVGSESKVIKINKNRHEAVVKINLFGNSREVSLGFDVIEKI